VLEDIHRVSKHKLHAIKDHFLDNGISPREHMETPGNSLSTPLALTGFWGFFNLSRIMLSSIPGRIPGFKQDDVKVLPSIDSASRYSYIKINLHITHPHTHSHTHTQVVQWLLKKGFSFLMPLMKHYTYSPP